MLEWSGDHIPKDDGCPNSLRIQRDAKNADCSNATEHVHEQT